MFRWIRNELTDLADGIATDERLANEVWEIAVTLDGAPDRVVEVTGIPGRFPVYAESYARKVAEGFVSHGIWDKEKRILYPPARITSVSIRKKSG